MNETLVTSFKALAEQEKQVEKPNTFRIRAYLKVAKIISEVKYEITSSDQVKDIPGIGEKTLLKIDEILQSGKLKKLDGFQVPKPSNKTNISEKKLLEGITGIGPVKAEKLVKEGYTLEKLKNMFASNNEEIKTTLTHHQILGVKYYDDLLKRIPYDEITKVNEYLNKILSMINKKHFIEDQFKMQICGSYRRMNETSGDIDVLFYNTKSDSEETDKEFFGKFLKMIVSTGFLKDHLTDPEKVTTKYMGFCKLPRKRTCRRIDMRCIKFSSLPAAMLYFTGSGEFNKNMRTFALKKGYTINEYGIFKLNSDKTKGPEIKVQSEADIFKTLGLEYIEPKDRLSTVKFK